MERILKRGDRVTVFEDVFTEKKVEGEATVWCRREWGKERHFEKVQVRFDGGDRKLVWRYLRMDKYSVNGKKVVDRERGEYPKKKAKRKLKVVATKGTEDTKKREDGSRKAAKPQRSQRIQPGRARG